MLSANWTEDDLKQLLKNMGQTELTTGKVPSYARKTNAAGVRVNDQGKRMAESDRSDIVAPGAIVALLDMWQKGTV